MGRVRGRKKEAEPNNVTQLSVVIPTMWKSKKLLTMLDIYESSKFISEVIIIDNDTPKRFNISHSKVKLVTRGTNIYVNPAWNWGVALSVNENIIIANDDVVIPNVDLLISEWLKSQYELLGVNYEGTRRDTRIRLQDAKELTYGFGCFMFVKKSKYLQLPYDFKIWRGDFLLRKHLRSGTFSGAFVDTDMSTTVNDFKEKASNDSHLWRSWKALEKELTIIIITYNRIAYTKKCIETFKRYTHVPYFMIIIDNGSTDGTREWIQTLDKTNTMIILSEENLMPRRSNQLGLQLAFKSDHYFICDNDGEFTKGWYENALKVKAEADIACLRKSRWLPIHKFKNEIIINKIPCYKTKYIASFSIMNNDMRNILMTEMTGQWIGVQIGHLAIVNNKIPVQVKDGWILDQSDNDINNIEYREQYETLWKEKKRLVDFNKRIGIINMEQGKDGVFALKELHNNTSIITINKVKGIVIKEIITDEYRELVAREIYWLNIFKDSGFVPKIISVDKNKITLDYCGEVLTNDNKPCDLYKQLFHINIELLKNHCYYNDWKVGNILVKDEQIYLIDFGWCPTINEDYTHGGYIQTERKTKKSGNYFTKFI